MADGVAVCGGCEHLWTQEHSALAHLPGKSGLPSSVSTEVGGTEGLLLLSAEWHIYYCTTELLLPLREEVVENDWSPSLLSFLQTTDLPLFGFLSPKTSIAFHCLQGSL